MAATRGSVRSFRKETLMSVAALLNRQITETPLSDRLRFFPPTAILFGVTFGPKPTFITSTADDHCQPLLKMKDSLTCSFDTEGALEALGLPDRFNDVPALLCGPSQTSLGTSMPSGDGHIIKALNGNKNYALEMLSNKGPKLSADS